MCIRDRSFTGQLIPKFNEVYYHILHKDKNGRTFVNLIRDYYNNPKLMNLSNEQFESITGIDKTNFIDFAKNFEGKIYTVSLHEGKTPDQYTWLEWDKRPSYSLEKKISDAFYKIREPYYAEYISIAPTGSELYQRVSEFFQSDKEASLFLLRSGIDGIKYPAESVSRGATSSTARGFNYVVFDENAVTIKSKAQKAEAPEITEPNSETFDKFTELTNFDKKISESSGSMKQKLNKQKAEYIKQNPSLSEITNNIDDILKQLEDNGLVTEKKGPCF